MCSVDSESEKKRKKKRYPFLKNPHDRDEQVLAIPVEHTNWDKLC